MFTDVRGHGVTTASRTAAVALSDSTERFIQRKTEVVPLLQASLDADPDCAFARSVFGLMLHGARNSALQPDMLAALERARAGQAESGRELQYLTAFEKAVAGDLFGLVDCYEKIINDNPTDLLALVLCQGELFWLGDMKRSKKITDRIDSNWNKDISGYADYLSVRAFDLEEAGDYEQAEAAGRQSMLQSPDCIWGAHAVAHVLLMQGRSTEGVAWLQGLQDNWQESNQMKFHIWWHQCLFHLELQQYDAVLAAYDSWVRNHSEALMQAVPDLYIDLQNGASMLWRLQHVGVDVADRWNEMAELVLPRLADMSSAFTSAHFAMILAAVGQYRDCENLLKSMHEFQLAGNHALASRYREAAIPAAQGAIAHRRGDYKKVLEVMMPARHHFWKMGGSHAQQDVFFQMLVDAAFKLGLRDQVQLLLAEIEQIGFTEPARRVAYEVAGRA